MSRVRAALAELVRLKALKERIEVLGAEHRIGAGMFGEYVRLKHEYDQLKEPAWQEARDALNASKETSMTTVKSKPNPKSSTIEIVNTKPGEWFEYRGTLFFHPKNRMKDVHGHVVVAVSFDNDTVITEDTHCRWDKVCIVRSVSINED